MDIIDIFKAAAALGVSDIHLTVGMPPMVRLQGHIKALPNFPVLGAEDTKALIYSVLLEEHRAKFEEEWELDTSIQLTDLPRFRLNVFREKDGVEAVFRLISSAIPKPADLGLTAAMTNLIDLPRGLVLVTGPTGSGKSTTLACLLNLINEKHDKNIITIEDPIEYLYENKKSIFRQREIGHHCKSYSEALRRSMRQDPDVILIGEMRDLETISLAITAAETGHLCFATLHTVDAPQTIDRVIDVFPPHQQQQIRVQLSTVLAGVISQTLLPTKDGKARVAARELMLMTPAISNLIRDGKTHMIYQAIDTSAKMGMFPLDRSLAELVKNGKINKEEALAHAHNPQLLSTWIGVGSAGASVAPSYS